VGRDLPCSGGGIRRAGLEPWRPPI
jgi:hypothetical protein